MQKKCVLVMWVYQQSLCCISSGILSWVQDKEHHQGAEGCGCSEGNSKPHPSHVLHIEQITFVNIQEHQVFLVWSPQVPLFQECYKLFPIVSKNICIDISRFCSLDCIARGSCFMPLVLYPGSFEENQTDHHSFCNWCRLPLYLFDLCHQHCYHCTCLTFVINHCLECTLSFYSNNLL